jgi:hypothetical protein
MPYTAFPALTGSPFALQTRAIAALWPYYDGTGTEVGCKIVLAQNTPHNTAPNTPIASIPVADVIAQLAAEDPTLAFIACVLADGRLVWIEAEAPFLVMLDFTTHNNRIYLPVGVVGPNYVLEITLIADRMILSAAPRGVVGKKDLARFKAGAAPLPAWKDARAWATLAKAPPPA